MSRHSKRELEVEIGRSKKRKHQNFEEEDSEEEKGGGEDNEDIFQDSPKDDGVEGEEEETKEEVDAGYQLEPFNLRQEREEGQFDADGTWHEHTHTAQTTYTH